MVAYSLKAAEILEKEGISCEVVNLRSLKPLGQGDNTASVRKTHRVVSIGEDWPGSMACQVRNILALRLKTALTAWMRRLRGSLGWRCPCRTLGAGGPATMPQIDDVVRVVKRMVGK